MNNANVLACITISMFFGFAVGYATGQNDSGKFTIHKTRSGMFIVDDTVNTMGKGKAEAKIYEVLELPTNKKSFQNDSNEIEFK